MLVDNMMLVDSMDDACWFHGWCLLIPSMMLVDYMDDAFWSNGWCLCHHASSTITKRLQLSSSIFKCLQASQASSSVFKHPRASSSVFKCLQASSSAWHFYDAFMKLSWCFHDAIMTISWRFHDAFMMLMLYDAWFWWFNDVLLFWSLTD